MRWDFDPAKGPHVNVNIGKGTSQVKYAVKESSTGAGDSPEAKKYMNNVVKQMNKAAGGYDMASNMGKDPPTYPESAEDSLEKMKDNFRAAATGPCG